MNTVGHVIDKVYVLIRPKRIPGGIPSQRLIDEIINNNAFKQLDKEKREKLIPISYDLTLSQLGLSTEDSVNMNDVHIAIHCASTSEYESSLEWNLETNVLGTIRLMDYLNQKCSNMCSFVYLSPIHIYQEMPAECITIKEQVYDLTGLGEAKDFLQQLLGADEKELPNFVKRILQNYSTLHLFTKALVEHLIIKKPHISYALAIFRSGYIGPSVIEPTPGWTSGVSGMSAWFALYGQSIPVIQPDQGQRQIKITPVDYLSRAIIRTLPHLTQTVYHIPPLATPATWYQAYTAIQDYWNRPSNSISADQRLPPAHIYFSANKALSKAKFLMRYYLRPKTTVTNITTTTTKKLDIDQSKWLELASNTRSSLAKQYLYDWEYETSLKSEDADIYRYLMQSCYGVKMHILHGGLHTRTSVVDGDCALYSVVQSRVMTDKKQPYPNLIDDPLPSIVYTEEDMKQRVKHMMDITLASIHHPRQSLEEEKVWKPVWIEYINDTLEDWCTITEQKEYEEFAGRWKMEDKAEMAKVTVLNDPQVMDAVNEVSKRSGMPTAKVIEEAIRSLNRIQERTQLSYAWFAASFLEKLFKNMFSCIRINKVELAKIRNTLKENKKIIYVPVSRTVLDPILVWFLAIRYNLPIPVLVLDEALAILGPFSDILRLAGAVFIKRDPSARSVLTTAVTSAYLKHLLQERGALTMVLEKVRSRSGLLQRPYDDGLLEMMGQDIAFVPIHLTYEEVPDLCHLVKQDLQYPSKPNLSRSKSSRMSTPTKLSRPSDSRAQRVRSRSLGHGQMHLLKQDEEHEKNPILKHHIGKVLVGFGEPVFFQDQEDIANKIQKGQKKAVVLTPVSLVAAILLFSRVHGNVIDLDTMKKHLKYLYDFVKVQGISVDWQDFEDSENIVFYSIRLLEKNSNIVTIEERSTSTLFHISIQAESVLHLAYYANQLQEVFILDSIFAVVYLSMGTKFNEKFVFLERFEFLVLLFQPYFSVNWNAKKELDLLFTKYEICFEGGDHSQLNLLASFIYPTIDSLWVTLCALSALVDDVKALPYSLVPMLTQWIGMHLISGRRTIYSEVLSTEYSQNALKSFFQLGLLTTESAKMILSPDTQMLMQALGLSTNEDLVVKQESHNIRDVCRKVEQVRIKQEEGGPLSTYVFEKCQNQIKSLMRTKEACFSKRMGATMLDPKEEAMIQLGYTLLKSMSSQKTDK
ncbi:hypothetical protein G6F56_000449 [Rhizopus delemar]|nr:hypothetical protein G6F56_000449 [Rhizopus delemar]